jgi:hypothetical protein
MGKPRCAILIHDALLHVLIVPVNYLIPFTELKAPFTVCSLAIGYVRDRVTIQQYVPLYECQYVCFYLFLPVHFRIIVVFVAHTF